MPSENAAALMVVDGQRRSTAKHDVVEEETKPTREKPKSSPDCSNVSSFILHCALIATTEEVYYYSRSIGVSSAESIVFYDSAGRSNVEVIPAFEGAHQCSAIQAWNHTGISIHHDNI